MKAALITEEQIKAIEDALEDMLSGWKYIRESHGDLYGIGWDRAESKAVKALTIVRSLKVQEPVAWLEYDDEGYLFLSGKRKGAFPVFIAPPSKPWVSLTDDEIDDIAAESGFGYINVARAIEAALKERNI